MKSDTKEHKKKKGHKNDYQKISVSMCYILRHGALERKLDISRQGYVKVEELLKEKELKDLNNNVDEIHKIVDTDKKGRYRLQEKEDGLYIRCNQGHSIPCVDDVVEPIEDPFLYPIVVHGTYYESWKFIEKTGLKRMTRNHIRIILI